MVARGRLDGGWAFLVLSVFVSFGQCLTHSADGLNDWGNGSVLRPLSDNFI